MALSTGNIFDAASSGELGNSPFLGTIGRLLGFCRVTTSVQTSIAALVPDPSNRLGSYDNSGATPKGSPMVIPDGAYVVQVKWGIPNINLFQNATSSQDVLAGTNTDALKVATVGQGVTVSVANSLGGISTAFGSGGKLPANAFDVAYGKEINIYANEASAVTGLGAYSGGTDASRAVRLFSVDSTNIAAGSGIFLQNIPVGVGHPQFYDIPIQVIYRLPMSSSGLFLDTQPLY